MTGAAPGGDPNGGLVNESAKPRVLVTLASRTAMKARGCSHATYWRLISTMTAHL